MADRFPELLETDLYGCISCIENTKKATVVELLKSVIARYRDLSMSRRSRYFDQLHPIIVNLFCRKVFGL